jgi:hypothetical protein
MTTISAARHVHRGLSDYVIQQVTVGRAREFLLSSILNNEITTTENAHLGYYYNKIIAKL